MNNLHPPAAAVVFLTPDNITEQNTHLATYDIIILAAAPLELSQIAYPQTPSSDFIPH